MSIVGAWIIFAVIIGIAASSRGRNGIGWFLISVLLSPLLGLLLLIALPRQDAEARAIAAMAMGAARPHDSPTKTFRTTAVRDKRDAPFVADGACSPACSYRVIDGGKVDAMLSAGLVRFRDMDQFMASQRGGDSH